MNCYTWPCVSGNVMVKSDLSSARLYGSVHTLDKSLLKHTRITWPCLSGRVVVFCVGFHQKSYFDAIREDAKNGK